MVRVGYDVADDLAAFLFHPRDVRLQAIRFCTEISEMDAVRVKEADSAVFQKHYKVHIERSLIFSL